MLVAAVPPGDTHRARTALAASEAALRDVEARMSAYLEASELSKLNRAAGGEDVILTPETMEILRAARNAATETDGAFDTTCSPLLTLWREAGEQKRLPSADALAAARAATGWQHFELTATRVRKKLAAARQDLGGVAKGHAIDRATCALRRAGIPSGLVDIGGDVRAFGPGPGGDGWAVQLRHPFRDSSCGTLLLRDAAVCTSGNYQRFTQIGGRRYSHIIDPRTGQPVENVPSVTVIAPDCTTADIWATALSVLGPKGLEKLTSLNGLEALLITGSPEDHKIHQTPGFARFLTSPLRLD
jgi:thiamine biosynthesis lipoprotein